MSKKFTVAALLAGSAFIMSAPAYAAAQDPAAQPAPEQTEPDQSDATADATIQGATQVDDLNAKIELLQAQVEALQEALDGVKAQQVKAVPTWKGAPEFADKDAGFTFKPKGFVQFDAGYVGFPDGDERRGTVSGLNFGNLGFNSRARRLVFGAEGTLPGRFGYKVEFNFAQGTVDYEDIILTYDFAKAPLQISVGNFYPYSSLETMTSSRLGSMIERASFTDAFNYNRRLGVGIQYSDKVNDSYLIQAGIFSTPINDSTNFTRTGWQASLRGIYSPTLGSTRLHIGANLQYRTNNKEAMGQQYRTRPLTQITDQRFIDTGTLASKGDTAVGIEFAAIHKSLHVAAEAQKVWVRDAFSAIVLDPDNNDTPTGTVLAGDPSFTGGYFEIGYFLTGETRAYKGGKWDRTKVRKPFSDGGWGAFQVNGRVDYVNLSDRVGSAPAGATPAVAFAAPYYVNGGKQLGLQMSLIWNPVDWVRFLAQYGHIDVTGGPRALNLVDPTKNPNKRNFSADTFAARAQVEF